MSAYVCPECGSTNLETVGVATFDLDGEYGTLGKPRAFEWLDETACYCKSCSYHTCLKEAREAVGAHRMHDGPPQPLIEY
jgi:hypothetical protein